MPSEAKIDEIDVKILKTLLKDARTNFTDIARDCGVSTNAIVKRFYRLKRTGVIFGTTLVVNLEEFGFNFFVGISLNIDPAEESRIIEELRGIPNVIHFYDGAGANDINVVAVTKDFEQIVQLRTALKNKKGITRIGIAAKDDKFNFFPENLLIQPTKGTCKNG